MPTWFKRLWLTVVLVWVHPAAGLTPAETRGQRIYLTGENTKGQAITAVFGAQRLEISGQAAACGNCHGHDGTGRPESGLVPSDIRWKNLDKTYGHRHTNGIVHAAYTSASLKRYLLSGRYPGGTLGDPSMPVYQLSRQDVDDVAAYLSGLGERPVPGVSQETIRIGMILAPTMADNAIPAVLEAYFKALNAQGGLYGRKLEWVVHRLASNPKVARPLLAAWLAEHAPFALIGNLPPGIYREWLAILSEADVPVVTAYALDADGDLEQTRQIFAVFPSLGEQVQALVRFAGEAHGGVAPRLAVLYPEGVPELEAIVAAAAQACANQGWPLPKRQQFPLGQFDAEPSARELQAAGIDLVLSLAEESPLRALLDAAEHRGWKPRVLVPGVLAGKLAVASPPGFAGRLHLAYPTLPADRKAWALDELSSGLTHAAAAHLPSQVSLSSLSAAKIVVEGLRRSGRALDRPKFISALEQLYRFDTGLTPPITFNRNRHTGTLGAYIVAAGDEQGAKLPVVSRWLEFE